MRLEANISLSPDGKLPHYKVEVKNINSFRFFANSLVYEFKRQAEILDQGETPVQETRGYRDGHGTVSQRGKEGAADYRYFPDPDIPPFVISREMVAEIKKRLPSLPDDIIAELKSYGLSDSAAKIISTDKSMLAYVREVHGQQADLTAAAGNAIANKKIDIQTTSPVAFIQAQAAKNADKITDKSQLTPLIEKILAENPTIVAQYKSGKTGVLGFFVGNVMKATAGKADPTIVSRLVTQMLK